MPEPHSPSPDPSTPATDLQLAVRCEGDCWILDGGRLFETLAYPSGGAAETAARTLASRFAQHGRGVRVLIEDRRHAVVGTRTYFPASASLEGRDAR